MTNQTTQASSYCNINRLKVPCDHARSNNRLYSSIRCGIKYGASSCSICMNRIPSSAPSVDMVRVAKECQSKANEEGAHKESSQWHVPTSSLCCVCENGGLYDDFLSSVSTTMLAAYWDGVRRSTRRNCRWRGSSCNL
jgi:hypothetical protein